MVTLGTFFILEFDSIYHVALDIRTVLMYLLIILIGTFIFPVNAIFLIQKLMRTDISVYMQDKEDRRIPLLIAAMCVLFTFYLFTYKIGYRAPHLIRGYLLGTATSIIFAAVVNLRYKISLHAIGLGGILGLLVHLQVSAFMDLRWLVSMWFIFTGMVLWARMYLDCHRLSEIYTGFITGFLMIYLIIQL